MSKRSTPLWLHQYEFPGVLPKLQADSFRTVWMRNNYRNSWHKRVGEVVMVEGGPPEPLDKFRLRLVRYSRRPEPDYDNLVFSYKPIIDGFIKAGVLVDDSPLHLLKSDYVWEWRGSNKINRFVVKIMEDRTNERATEELWK